MEKPIWEQIEDHENRTGLDIDDYHLYVSELLDSREHKNYITNNYRCYLEWLEEKGDK